MPCPYFLPKEPLRETGWVIPPRAPLGLLCSGECHAGLEPKAADHDRCNFGYARGVCDLFPADAPADAVRFALRPDGVFFVLERDHVPVAHGTVLSESQPILPEGQPILKEQARIFKLHAPLLFL